MGSDTGTNPNPYTNYVFGITPVVGGGGQFILRFAEVDNQGPLNLGVDSVPVEADAIPEPCSLALLGMGTGVLAMRRRRKA
jgi:hypothetical protein